MADRSGETDQNLDLRGKHLVYVEYIWLLN